MTTTPDERAVLQAARTLAWLIRDARLAAFVVDRREREAEALIERIMEPLAERRSTTR